MVYSPSSPPYVGPVAHFTAGNNKPIIRIVIHCTVGSDATGAAGTVRYFKSEASRGSAHYVVDRATIYQCAFDSVICWHAPPNKGSLGYELCCSLTNQGKGHWEQQNHIDMMGRAAKSVAENCLAYGLPIRKLTAAQVRAGEKGICGHQDVSDAFGQSSHWDPGPYFPWGWFIKKVQYWADQIVQETGSEEDDMPYTQEQIRALVQAEIEEYAVRFWIEPTGTGKGIRDQLDRIEQKLDTDASTEG